MFKLLLILKYVRRKVAPLFAASAVTLCTAMVIIVISVMGGFLEMWRDTAKRLTGEITLSAGLGGFPHYDEMIAALDAHPDIEAATPVCYTFGLVKIDDNIIKTEIVGVRGKDLDKVVAFKESLYWTPEAVQRDLDLYPDRPEPGVFEEKGYRQFKGMDLIEAGMSFQPPVEWNSENAGIVPGIAVYPSQSPRDRNGHFSLHRNRTMGRDIVVTVLPMTEEGGLLDPSVKRFTVVNEVKSGFINYDSDRMFVGFDTLQQMLLMDEADEINEEGEPTGNKLPAKATWVLINGRDGLSLKELRERVVDVITPIYQKHLDMPNLFVRTWEDQHRTILNAVEKEKFLLVVLFAIISLVAFVMVMVTFYNIVLEKTRDIGVLRAIGASRNGVASLFLGYGLAIGLVGVALGFFLASAIVNNINAIQYFLEFELGRGAHYACFVALGVVLGIVGFPLVSRFTSWGSRAKWGIFVLNIVIATIAGHGIWTSIEAVQLFWTESLSVRIWDAQVYYFDAIPAKMNPKEVGVICIAAVLSSVFGSLVPAILASRQDPVEALRYE